MWCVLPYSKILIIQIFVVEGVCPILAWMHPLIWWNLLSQELWYPEIWRNLASYPRGFALHSCRNRSTRRSCQRSRTSPANWIFRPDPRHRIPHLVFILILPKSISIASFHSFTAVDGQLWPQLPESWSLKNKAWKNTPLVLFRWIMQPGALGKGPPGCPGTSLMSDFKLCRTENSYKDFIRYL